MNLQNIPAIYPEGAAAQQQAAAMAQAAQAQQIAGMAQAGAAAQAGMPVSHRPMRQAGRQLRSTTQLHAVVEACQTVRIACVDEEGPFIVPMSFGYDWADPEEIDADAPRLALWVHSAGVGRKVDAFNREPRVAIEMGCAGRPDHRHVRLRIFVRVPFHHGHGHHPSHPGDRSEALRPHTHHAAPGARSLDRLHRPGVARANIYCIDVDRFTGKQRA